MSVQRVGEIEKVDGMKYTTIRISNEAVKYLISAIAKYKEFGDKDDFKRKKLEEDLHKALLEIHGELNPS